MVDPFVDVVLVNGHILTFKNMSIMEMADELHGSGCVIVSDSRGNYVHLFQHGVAALVARREDIART